MTLTLIKAIELYEGNMRRRGFQPTSQHSYSRRIRGFAKHIGNDTPVDQITKVECAAYLDRFDNHEPSTIALAHTILSGLFTYLELHDHVVASPMRKVERPRVPKLKDRKRTRITQAECEAMLAACESWDERVALHLLAYTGVRRTAASELRWRDVDGKAWTLTFREKGNKTISKPIARALGKVLTAYAIECGPFDPDAWVVPNKGAVRRADGTRSNRVIYGIVKRVAKRAGVTSHCHAIRAAFAVHFIRSNPDQMEALRRLMGHESMQTTLGYLDEAQTSELMQIVDTLDFSVSPSSDTRRAA